MMKQYKTKLLQFLILLIFLSLSCSFVTIRFPFLTPYVQLNELHLCEREIKQEINATEKQRYCANTFSSDKEELYLCGSVAEINDIDVYLDILLFKEKITRPTYTNSLDDSFTNGYFCRLIPLPDKDNRIGNYVVELHYHRDTLGSINFEIR